MFGFFKLVLKKLGFKNKKVGGKWGRAQTGRPGFWPEPETYPRVLDLLDADPIEPSNPYISMLPTTVISSAISK
jgi:hypothetical protein